MFPSGFPKPPCSWNVGSAPLCCCFCNSLWEANKHGGIEQELLGHQPWRRSKECRMHVDHPNRTKIMINRISCRFKWDGNWEGRQSSFLAAGVLLLKSQSPRPSEMMCSMWIFVLVLSVAGTVWVWCLCFLSLLSLSGGYFTELKGLSQCYACPPTLLAPPALGQKGKFPDGPNISRVQGNMALRGRLRGINVYKFTGEALTFVIQAYNIFFKGKISLPA